MYAFNGNPAAQPRSPRTSLVGNPLAQTRITVQPPAMNLDWSGQPLHRSTGPHASDVARHTHVRGLSVEFADLAKPPN